MYKEYIFINKSLFIYVYVSDRLMDDLMMYIKGETDQLPINDNPLPNDVKDIFYLMADFNFKNKTWVNS